MPVATPPPVPVQTKRILMIDDDEMMRILFREMFWIYSDPAKTDITIAPSVADAYEKLKGMPRPDVIVLGLSLMRRDRDGTTKHETTPSLEFIKNIKSENRNVKVVVYSRHSEAHLKELAKEAGADHYLVKGELAPREIVDFIEAL